MKKIMKQWMLALVVGILFLAVPVSASGRLDTEGPTKQEIAAKWQAVTSASELYVSEPSVTAPYAAGELSASFLESGITYLNYVRFVANLPAVQLDDTLNEDAQHGAVLLAAVDTLTHYPIQPADMDDDFYARGYAATTSSNLSARYGYNQLTCLQGAVSGCMADSSSVSNLSCLGHRRWLLNPTLLNVGFGYARAESGWSYIDTKVFDRSGASFDYDFIGWPAAGNFPTNLFATTTPWSITLNPARYSTPDADQVQITITREADGKTWHFDGSTGAAESTAKAYMMVDTNGYGVRNCIIFHPGSDNIDAYEGVFTVDVSGIYDSDGNAASLHYQVDFFDVEDVCIEHSYEAVVTAPTCTEPGYTTYTCTACGDSYVAEEVPATGHHYVNGVCSSCGAMPEIHGTCGEGVIWYLTDDGTLTISGTGAMKDYTYKSEMPWYGYFDQITSVVLEEGVTSIGDYAFYGMDITSIEIPDSVTAIGSYAFKNAAQLDHVVLPAGVTKLGESAFYGCASLTAIDIPASLWTIQPYTFKNCTALATVKFHEGNLLKISDGAFYGTALTEVVLPDCLDILDEYAFKNCAKLESVTIGSGITEIREAVFYGTAIPTIEIPEGITKIGPYAFKNCVALETISLPSTLTSVGEASFYACTALKSVELPDTVTTIGNYAFRKCAAIETLTFGAELTTIGECSFYGCTGLTEIVIPGKVTTIKPYAFKTCTGLTSVTQGSSVATIGEGAFNTCTGLKTIVFPASVTTIGDYCFSGSYNLWKLTFEGDAPAIGTGAFKSVEADAYYPGNNATWTSDNMLNYGGTITWKAK